jgi:hypothetical protein
MITIIYSARYFIIISGWQIVHNLKFRTGFFAAKKEKMHDEIIILKGDQNLHIFLHALKKEVAKIKKVCIWHKLYVSCENHYIILPFKG